MTKKVVRCPYGCGGQIKEEVVKNYDAGVFGIIPEATFHTCDKCGERSCSAKEIKRWEGIRPRIYNSRQDVSHAARSQKGRSKQKKPPGHLDRS